LAPTENQTTGPHGDRIGLPNLSAMAAELREAPAIVQPSVLWEELNERNLAQLEEQGFDEFKRTVNGNYFQFIPAATKGSEQFQAVLRDFIRHPRLRALGARVIDAFEIPELRGQGPREMRALRYGFYVAALWEHVRRRDSRELLERVEEPALGHPVAIRYRGRLITEDLCNSAEELTAVLDGLGIAETMPAGTRMIELGAGYGRLSWAFLALFPGIRCVVVDIPPALAISERYLTEVFPERPAFRFRHFESYEEIRAGFEQAEIAFLTPNQLDLVPPMEADLFATVSSLHEMRPEQIKHYLGEAGRHAAGGHFYFKQWQSYSNPSDEVTISRQDYPIPPDWELIFDRPHPVQALFFEAMYRLPDGVG
jgi:putative sugar O-methyltransferase